jgi:hypothetical protein
MCFSNQEGFDVKTCILAAVFVALSGISYAAADEIELGNPINLTDDHAAPAKGSLFDVSPGDLRWVNCDSCCNAGCGDYGCCDPCCDACCDSCCDPCCGGCCDNCCQQWFWTAGVEATYLKPHVSNDIEGEDVGSAFSDMEFAAAPRVWLGVENCNGWGARARYWQYNNSRAFSDIGIIDDEPFGLEGSSFDSFLNAYVIDAEATRRLCIGNWNLLGSFGFRHVQMNQTFHGTFVDIVDGEGAFLFTEQQALGFNGSGLTLGAEAVRPIGCSGFSLFLNSRGSVLWGHSRTRQLLAEGAVDGEGDFLFAFQSDERFNDTLFMGEFQIGPQWNRRIACINADVFARAVFEAQWWHWGSGPQELANGAEAQVIFEESSPRNTFLYGAAFTIGITR